ncbi:MAG TPA: DUF4105 domain-containing protein [Gammaproteobacteria bacterium]|nr:DUF4105 domain-containing protein [Gammaproteobacteria bacterium]
MKTAGKFSLLVSALCLFLLLPAYGAVHENALVAQLQDRARQDKLWQYNEWLNLLHYEGSPGRYKSSVKDPRFFLADDGNTSPQAELQATLAAIFSTQATADDHAQCRFIARYRWLKKQLSIPQDKLPAITCPAYTEWRTHVSSDSVAMIFPAYHLNSPTSMFGHTLLRIDAVKNGKSNDWLSTAVNFGANVDPNDNSILYAWRGLVGGYSGIFVIDHYYKKIQEYGRIEHRDIWEYQLNLNHDEIENLITHLWEIRNINFTYYYFDENCSYRLLELLEVARPGVDLTSEFVLTAIPVDTVRSVEAAGMIESADYLPAQATKLQAALDQTPAEDLELILQLSKDLSVAEKKPFTELSAERQVNIIDTAYQYLRYQHNNKQRDPLVAKQSYRLLVMLNTYPRDKQTKIPIKTPSQPQQGHGSKRLDLGLGKRNDNAYLNLGFKMSFHDLEDNIKGYLQGAQINIGTMQLRLEDNVGLRLYNLDLINVFSLSPRNRFFKPLSWKVYTGFERELTLGKDQLLYHFSGGIGGSWQLVKNHQFYALGMARLESNKQMKNFIEPGIGFTSGFLSHFGHSTAHLNFSGEQFQAGIYRLRVQYTQNFVIRTNHSLKFYAKQQWQEDGVEYSDINLSYQYYF